MIKKQDIQYMKAIVSAGTISAAAENLGISQPALSAFLRKKEAEVDAVIFDRSTQPVQLTDAGKAYMEYLDRNALSRKELEQNLADIRKLKTGSLTIGGASFFNVAYLPVAVAQFMGKYPGINLEIVDGKVPELVTAAQKGELDLFITPIADEDDRFVYEEFLEEKIYLCVPSDWEENAVLAGKQIPVEQIIAGMDNGQRKLSGDEFATLCHRIFVVLKPDQHLGRFMGEIFKECHCQPKHMVTVAQTMTSLALTRAGVGVSLITGSSIRHADSREGLTFYQVAAGPDSREMYVAYLKNKYLSQAAQQFLQILKDVNKMG